MHEVHLDWFMWLINISIVANYVWLCVFGGCLCKSHSHANHIRTQSCLPRTLKTPASIHKVCHVNTSVSNSWTIVSYSSHMIMTNTHQSNVHPASAVVIGRIRVRGWSWWLDPTSRDGGFTSHSWPRVNSLFFFFHASGQGDRLVVYMEDWMIRGRVSLPDFDDKGETTL